jgi:peptide deformylase
MKILKFPHPILFEPCEEVTDFSSLSSIKEIMDAMWKIMKESNGMGLAANQVGLKRDMFVLAGPSGRLNMVNPYISARSQAPANLKEGCLSAPGQFTVVPSRSKWVQVKYQDETGAHKSILLEGIHAVAAAHEIDHLDGKSFMQDPSLPKALRKAFDKKWGLK